MLLPASYRAEAQFWKKKDRKEKREKRIDEKPTTATKLPSFKKEKIDYPPSERKDRYRIDLLVPLYLDELVKGGSTTFKAKTPDKLLAGLGFYQGVKLAADTLNRLYSVDLYVHDISSKEFSVSKLISNKLLESSDLIIGAVPSPEIEPLAKLAKKKQINFVSVLSPGDGGVRDNPFFTIIQPSLHTHCEWISSNIRRKYPRQKIFIYHKANVQVDENAWSYATSVDLKSTEEINCNSLPKANILRTKFDSTGSNVIIMPILETVYADSLLAQLDREFPNYRFDVYGMPSWSFMGSIKKADAYNNIAVYFTTPFYYDPASSLCSSINLSFKEQFGGKPSEWVYRGYEAFYAYAYLLKRYGTIFNRDGSDNGDAISTKYDIRPRWDKDHNLYYNENRHVYLYRYQGGSYMIEQ